MICIKLCGWINGFKFALVYTVKVIGVFFSVFMCDLHNTEADVFFVKLCDSVLDWVYKSTAVSL